MKRRTSLLFAISLLCVTTRTVAVWEYSLEARVALNDAVVLACGAIAPVATKATVEEFERTLSVEERKQLPVVRNAEEYKTVLEAALKEARQLIVGTSDAKYTACQAMLQR